MDDATTNMYLSVVVVLSIYMGLYIVPLLPVYASTCRRGALNRSVPSKFITVTTYGV